MLKRHTFEVQLDNFRNEANLAARYMYAEMAIQHAASKSSKLLNRLNRTPTFWITCGSALQSSAYISIARIFDVKSDYNVNALLKSMEDNLSIFQKDALESRKRIGNTTEPEWLEDYLLKAYYPKIKDVERLQKKVSEYRVIYDKAIKPVRNKYLAHREKQDSNEVANLYAGGKLKELWRVCSFLLQLHSLLQELFFNGKKPVMKAIRYSPKVIFDSATQGSSPHESIVGEVKRLMHFIETKE